MDRSLRGRNSLWFRDGDASSRLAQEKVREILILQLTVRVVQEGRDTKGHAGGDGTRGARKASAAHL